VNALVGEHLDGPALFAWMTSEGLIGDSIDREWGDSTARRFREWRKGGVATIARVDAILTSRGRHINEIPDAIWLADIPARIRAALLDGRRDCDIAREVGVCRQAVRYHRRQMGLEPATERST
jgi:hypothetical protein